MTDAPAVVLLVDDVEAKRYLLATWLRRAGHTVIEAATGREALAKVGAAELVLLAVHLPDLSGYEVCRQIKDDPATSAIPVVQVSATAVGVSDRARGLTQGADAYLTEPTEPEELLAVVMAALRYYRARQRAERMASLLAALTSSTLDINAAGTFDGLARAAARRGWRSGSPGTRSARVRPPPPSWSRGRTGCGWSPTARCSAMSAWRRPGPSRTDRR